MGQNGSLKTEARSEAIWDAEGETQACGVTKHRDRGALGEGIILGLIVHWPVKSCQGVVGPGQGVACCCQSQPIYESMVIWKAGLICQR